MSDEIDKDLLKEMEEAGIDTSGDGDGSIEATSGTGTRARAGEETGARSRMFGLVALLLGVIGSFLMVITAFLVLRFGFNANDNVARVIEPVEVSFDRMEDRIDETDDLVDREGIAPDRIDELQARVDGLVDVSTSAHQVFEAVEDHPIYRLLPAELSTLGEALADFEQTSTEIDDRLGTASNGDELDTEVAGAVADRLDALQGQVSTTREMIDDAASSLRSWIRVGSFLGFLGSLWGLWGQLSLARRGWGRFRGRVAP